MPCVATMADREGWHEIMCNPPDEIIADRVATFNEYPAAHNLVTVKVANKLVGLEIL